MSTYLNIVNFLLKFRANDFVSAESVMKKRVHNRPARAEILPSLQALCNIQIEFVQEREVITLTPKHRQAADSLLYIHGGGYVSDLIKPHWQIIEYLMKNGNMRVCVPIYRLAPETDLDSELPFMREVYEQLCEQTSGKIFVAGDSAGGNFSLALASDLRERQAALPHDIFLFSPWLDLSMSHPDIAALEKHDPMLASTGLKWCGEQWAGRRSVQDPLVSPIFGNLHGLPPLHIYQGTHDIFLADVQKFTELATQQNAVCHTHIYPKAFHVFVGTLFLLEARHALDNVLGVIAQVTQ